MKKIFPISLLVFSLTMGCKTTPAQQNDYGNHRITKAIAVQTDEQPRQNQKDDIVMVPIEENGRVAMLIPYPASWKTQKASNLGDPYVTGPNELILSFVDFQSFSYFNDWQTNQLYAANGAKISTPIGVEAVVAQNIIPHGRKMGMEFITQYPLNEVAKANAEYMQRIGSGNTLHHAIGTEWKDNNGNKALIVIQYTEMPSHMGVSWNYVSEMMKVKASDFEKSKKHFLYALTNKEHNQQVINDINNKMAQQQQQDFNNIMDHQQKMRNISARGAAERNRINSETRQYVNDLNRQSEDYRQRTNEDLYNRRHNYIVNENTVISPFDGKTYQVESGAQTYWFNDRGEYIKSDDKLYDPNDYENYQGVWKKATMKY